MSWSAETLEQKYGSLLLELPCSDAGTPRQLFRMLEQQKPRDKISEGVCKSWFGKYRVARESSANTAQEFEERYGDRARPLVEEHNSAYKLTKALLALDPPVCISDQLEKRGFPAIRVCDISKLLDSWSLSLVSVSGRRSQKTLRLRINLSHGFPSSIQSACPFVKRRTG